MFTGKIREAKIYDHELSPEKIEAIHRKAKHLDEWFPIDGQWRHLVRVVDGDTLKYFIDGEFVCEI